jgi:hypothetical protein
MRREKAGPDKAAKPSKNARMMAYRQKMRAAGLRPVQLWVPDTRSPEFIEKCRLQSEAVAASDPAGDELMEWVESMYEWPD